MIDIDLLAREAQKLSIELSPETLEKFDAYANLLVETNKSMNLTAITDPEGIVYKHFIDSLTALSSLPKGHVSLVDVGSGAGFPGIPLLLARPDLEVTVLDSLEKRLRFIETLCDTLGLKVKTVHARAEEAGQDPLYREQYDVAIARAVAYLPVLCEWCIPLIKPDGFFISMKGSSGLDETDKSQRAIKILGGQQKSFQSFNLQTGTETYEKRSILMVGKIESTPEKYPRTNGKIKKQPL